MITVAVNSKKYFEKYKNENINKNYKGVRKDRSGMMFGNYAQRITSLRDHDSKTKNPKKNYSKTFSS